MSIITNDFNIDNAKELYDSLELDNDLYIFASYLSFNQSENTNKSVRDFFDKTIFGKKISFNNIKFLIKNNKYIPNIVYDMYDDSKNLKNLNYYVVVYPENIDSGFYRIYKCLFNNYGAPSTQSPSFIEGIFEYRLQDGYIWKYMFTLNNAEFNLFKTANEIPIIQDNTVELNAKEGVDVVIVENRNTNFGYDMLSGNVISSLNTNEILINLTNFSLLKKTDNYYVNHRLYVSQISGNLETRVYDIVRSTYNQNTNSILVEISNNDSFVSSNMFAEILPKIEIKGNGSGLVVKPTVDISTKRISKIDVLDSGNNYTNLEMKVVSPIGFTNENGIEAIIRPIISPKGGHGKNVQAELLSNKLLISGQITAKNSVIIPDTNFYSKIGIVKNPSFDVIEKEVFEITNIGKTVKLNNVTNLEVGFYVKNDNIKNRTKISSIDTLTNTVTLSGNVPIENVLNPGEIISFEKNPNEFDNRVELIVSDSSVFTQNDFINQIDSNGNEIVSGIVHEVTDTSIFITDFVKNYSPESNKKSAFTTDLSIRKLVQNNVFLSYDPPLGIIEPIYINKTGSLIYFTDFIPIERKPDTLEQFKIVIRF